MADEKTQPRSEADAVAALATKSQQFPFVHETDDGRLLAMIPAGGGAWAMSDVSDPMRHVEPPPHIKQAVVLQTVDSLVDYANRFKTSRTLLFADISANSITAALDYHQGSRPGAAGSEIPIEDEQGEADRVDHTARMALPYSVEWETWTKMDGKLVSQLEFARFLEENGGDIVAPQAADLLEACRDLQAVRKVDFKAVVRTNTDTESFEYSDDTQATSKRGDVEVPTKFVLSLPVYFGEPPTELHAFLRWNLDDGKLFLGVKLHRAEHVRQAVFKQIVLTAAEGIGQPAVFGKLA